MPESFPESRSPADAVAVAPANRRRSRKALLSLGIFIASIPTLLVLLAFPVANYYFDWQWEKTRTAWEAQGEVFSLESLIDPAIAEEENFAKSAIIDEVYRKKAAHFHADHSHGPDSEHSEAEHSETPRSRLASFSIYSDAKVLAPPADRILSFLSGRSVQLGTFLPQEAEGQSPLTYLENAFSPHEPIIQELMEAAKRPDAQYHFDLNRPSKTELAHLPPLIPAIHSLRLHNLVLIESGPEFQDLAAERLLGALRLIRHGTASEGLASFSIRTMALESAGLEVIWQALHRQRFSEAQWAEIDRELRSFEFGPLLMHTLRFERAAVIRQVENGFKHQRKRPFSVPPAWVNLNGLIEYTELTQRYWFTDAVGGRLLKERPRLDQLAAIEEITRDMEPTAADFVVAMGVIPVHDFALRAAWIEAQHSNALIAIALERYRLANDQLPEKLSELVPEWLPSLPVNPLTDQPPRYEPSSPAAPESRTAAIAYRLRPIVEDSGRQAPIWVMSNETPISKTRPVAR